MDDVDFQKVLDSLGEDERIHLKTVFQYVAQCFKFDSPYSGVLIAGNHKTRQVITIALATDESGALGLLSHALEKLADDIEGQMHIPKEKKH